MSLVLSVLLSLFGSDNGSVCPTFDTVRLRVKCQKVEGRSSDKIKHLSEQRNDKNLDHESEAGKL